MNHLGSLPLKKFYRHVLRNRGNFPEEYTSLADDYKKLFERLKGPTSW